jgi:hypothetical protein
VWPCNGDVGKADADVNEVSAAEAWRNGVLYSNGNCAIRQLGIPTVSVPMGIMADIGMPVNLTFAFKAYDDSSLFRYAYAFEKAGRLRKAPGRTPQLETDAISLSLSGDIGLIPPVLTVETAMEGDKVRISGTIGEASTLRVYVDGKELKEVKMADGHWEVARPKEAQELGKAMVVVVATGKMEDRVAGWFLYETARQEKISIARKI